MNKPKYIDKECDSIPKLRIESTGHSSELWLGGRHMGDGISKVEFKAEGGDDPLLHIDMNMRAFKFEPEKDLTQTEKGQMDSPNILCSIDKSILKLCKMIEEDNFMPGERSGMVQALAALVSIRACVR